MSIHRIEFEYDLPESDIFEMDIDPALDQIEKEAAILLEIKENYQDITNINILQIKEI